MTDAEPVVLSALNEGILRIRLNRPKKLNAVSYEMIGLLLEQIDRAAKDTSVRTVVLSGEGRAFCAGDDAKSMGPLPRELSPGENPIGAMQQVMIRNWYWLRKPTVAAVHGHCHGIGHDLALAADFRIVAKNAIMGDIRAARAIPVGSGGTYLLPRVVGLPAATEIMLTGKTLDSSDIARVGLATELVDDEALETTVADLALRLSRAPTKAIGQMKYELRKNIDQDLNRALELELELLDAPVDDRLEGRASFAEGRDPVFKGT